MPIILIVLEDQGGGIIRWNYKEVAPALRAQMDGHPPEVVLEVDEEDTDREEVF